MLPKTKKNDIKPIDTSNLSKNDVDMMNELDYEEKKKHMPFDPYRRHWDEA